MSDLWGALGQVIPAATTLTDAYTVPAMKHATLEITICNQAGPASVRIQHSVAGEASATKQYLLYDLPLLANEAKVSARITAAAGDVFRVYASTATVSFNVNGIEEND